MESMKKLIPIWIILEVTVFGVQPTLATCNIPSSDFKIIDQSTSGGFLQKLTKDKPLYESTIGGYVAPPHVSIDGQVYVTPSSQTEAAVVELSRNRSVKTWRVSGGVSGGVFELPKDRIGVLSNDGTYMAIDKKSRQVVFTKKLSGSYSGTGVLATLMNGTQVVLVAGSDGKLLGLHPETGESITSINLPADLAGTPLVQDGHIGIISTNKVFSWGTNPNDANSFHHIRVKFGPISDPMFANQRFYFGTSKHVYAVPVAGGAPIIHELSNVNGETVMMNSRLVSLDSGQVLLGVDSGGRLHFFGPQLEELAPPINLGFKTDVDMTLSPDGRFVAIPSAQGVLIIYDSENGTLIKSSGFGPMNAPVSFSADGAEMYVADNEGMVNVVKLNLSKAKQLK